MRLSEKTLELSICSQLAALLKRRVIWFGLTQRQEARAGFDACAKLGLRLVIFQFKASRELRDNGSTRRFKAPHLQMEALRQRVRQRREVFFVLPHLGTTAELGLNSDLLSQTWVLDVADFPPLAPPTNADGSNRRSGEHYLDLAPPIVTVRSEPVPVKATTLLELADQLGADLEDRTSSRESSVLGPEPERWPFSRKSLAVGIGQRV